MYESLIVDELIKSPELQNGEYYISRGLEYCSNILVARVYSEAAGKRIVRMFQEVFKETTEKTLLENLFGTIESTCYLEVDSKQPNFIQVKIEVNIENQRQINALNVMIHENGDIINKEIISEALNLKWTKSNIWRYEAKDSFIKIFDFNKLKELIHKVEEDVLDYPYEEIVFLRNTGMQNQFMYFGTFLDLNTHLGIYNDKSNDKLTLENAKEKILTSLNLINEYFNSEYFYIRENFKIYNYEEREMYIEKIKRIISEMLIADFD